MFAKMEGIILNNDVIQPLYQPPILSAPPPTRKRLPTWAIVTISISGVMALCCVGLVVFTASPMGKQLIAQTNATSTAQAVANLNAHATSTAYTLAHPVTTSKPLSTTTPLPVATSTVTTTVNNPTVPPASPTPVASSSGSVLNGATFGGTSAAFDARYGASADNLYQQGSLTFSINLTSGTDGNQHVFGMLAYNTDASKWSLDQAKTICPMFNPPDARHLSDATDSQGNFTQIYFSANLKATLPANQFASDAPGTFIIDYEQGKGVSGIFQCSIDS